MDGDFFSRPLGLWLLTLAVAAALLGLGYELAGHYLEPQLNEARLRLAEETSRANRLEAEGRALEGRLAQAEAALNAKSGLAEAEGGPGQNRLLHRGEAAILLQGRLVVALEGFSADRRQAMLRVKLRGGQEGGVTLTVGAETRLRLEDQHYRLVLKKILANSVVLAILEDED